ncbi:hypothetical protein BN1723_006229 [Verticillium longisporum]|uniref:Uncharacterized protein n=1 Tax=Verticillium longisporum TaxID=100787 RepID=A0A0G4KNI9_VERLO|nr:hypothetical protein BN1708_010115 [Verticillium longisporum]CRK44636.1 hypothetical protein BN1723_006229 [Verticillium longisporum]
MAPVENSGSKIELKCAQQRPAGHGLVELVAFVKQLWMIPRGMTVFAAFAAAFSRSAGGQCGEVLSPNYIPFD